MQNETTARLILQGAMDFLKEVEAAPHGWMLMDLSYVGMRDGEARYRVRIAKGADLIELTEYIPWKLVREHAPRFTLRPYSATAESAR